MGVINQYICIFVAFTLNISHFKFSMHYMSWAFILFANA